MNLKQLVEAAWSKRQALHECQSLNVYRVFHGFADGLPGINIDLYDSTLVINYGTELSDSFPALRESYIALKPNANIIAKAHQTLDLPLHKRFELLAGEKIERVIVNEFGTKYAIYRFAR